MGVELIGDKHPCALRVRGHRLPDMLGKIFFCASSLDGRAYDPAGRHLEVGYQCLGAVPFIFKFQQFGFAGFHWMIRMDALHGLNPGLFIRAHQMHPLSMEFFGLVIKFAHGSDVLPKYRFVFHRRIEPLFCPVRLELPLILKNARCFGRK